MNARDFSKQLRRRLAEGVALDAALRELRLAEASIIECITAIKSVRRCDLAEAKKLIHDSTAWADVIKRTDGMWAKLLEELDSNAEPTAAPTNGSATSAASSSNSDDPPLAG